MTTEAMDTDAPATDEAHELAKLWRTELEPGGQNPEDVSGDAENTRCLIIYLNDGNGTREEVSRVAFVRRASKNRKNGFQKQLEKELATAQSAADALNASEQRAREARLEVERIEATFRSRRAEIQNELATLDAQQAQQAAPAQAEYEKAEGEQATTLGDATSGAGDLA